MTVALPPSDSVRNMSRLAFLNTEAVDYQQRLNIAAALGKLGIYTGSLASPLNVARVLSHLKEAYPKTGAVSHPRLLSKQEAVELAYWLLSAVSQDTCDETEKNRILSAAFYLTSGIAPPAHLDEAFKAWIGKSISNLRLNEPPKSHEKLEVWQGILCNASLASSVLQIDLRIPSLKIANAGDSTRLARFQINHASSCAGSIVINEELLQAQYRQLTEKATFALGVACVVHEMTHAAQHALLAGPARQEPFFRALALACALDGELPSRHWLETYSTVPESLSPNCLLPHELQAWTSTKETLLALGQNNPDDTKHIEQALLYISPILKQMGLSNG